MSPNTSRETLRGYRYYGRLRGPGLDNARDIVQIRCCHCLTFCLARQSLTRGDRRNSEIGGNFKMLELLPSVERSFHWRVEVLWSIEIQ